MSKRVFFLLVITVCQLGAMGVALKDAVDCIKYNNFNQLQKILFSDEREWDINNNSVFLQTPLLYLAVQYNRIEITNLLFEFGADPNVQEGENNRTALHEAIDQGCIEIVTLLVQKGAYADIKDNNNQTPFDLIKYQCPESKRVELYRLCNPPTTVGR
ncbi:MAG: ankyrin repeat domain-containing protein [Candidatus Babeliaceae bacterium]